MVSEQTLEKLMRQVVESGGMKADSNISQRPEMYDFGPMCYPFRPSLKWEIWTPQSHMIDETNHDVLKICDGFLNYRNWLCLNY